MPNSRSRRVTWSASRPYKPTAARTSPTSPNDETRTKMNRSVVRERVAAFCSETKLYAARFAFARVSAARIVGSLTERPSVCRTKVMSSSAVVACTSICASGRAIMPRTSPSRGSAIAFISPTTPIIVNHGRVPSSRPQRIRLPIGESLGQKRFAILWLTMQTSGASAASLALKSRPWRIGCPMLRKYPGTGTREYAV